VGNADGLGGPECNHGIGNARRQQCDDVAACHAEFPEQARDTVQASEKCTMGQADRVGLHGWQEGDCRRLGHPHRRLDEQAVDGRPIFGGNFRIV
jgi:hypothetical protein